MVDRRVKPLARRLAVERQRDRATREVKCVIEGTLDARLIAVDARTGRPCAGFGANGAVSITRGMGRVLPGMVSITSPPVIVRGVIVTGHQVLDGQRNDAPSGVIQAFDAETGAFAWAWDLGAPRTQAVGDLHRDRRKLEANHLRAEDFVEDGGLAAGFSSKDRLERLALSIVRTIV